MWTFCGPSFSVTPVQIELYGFIRSPVAERGSSCRNTSRSRNVGISFSIPTTLISVSGSVRHMRPLPSDSATSSPPVSAIAKLAPLTATGVFRNSRLRCRRAASARSCGSSVRSFGASGMCSRKIWRISARLRWSAGTTMWLGRSCDSWMIISARSVSCAVIPWFSRAFTRPISWVAIDLTLMTSS